MKFKLPKKFRITKNYFNYSLEELQELSPKQFNILWDKLIEDSIPSVDGKVLYLNSEVKDKVENNNVGFYLYTDWYRAFVRRFKEGQTLQGSDVRVSQQAVQDTRLLILDFIPSEKALEPKFDDKIRLKMNQICQSTLIDEGVGKEWIEITEANPINFFREAYKLETQSDFQVEIIRDPYTVDLTSSPSNAKAWKVIVKQRSLGISRYQILKHCGTRKTMDIHKSMSSLMEINEKSICMLGAHLNSLLNQHFINFVEEDKARGEYGKIAYLGIASNKLVDKELSPDNKEEVELDKNTILTFHNENDPKGIKEWVKSKSNDPSISQIRILFNYDSSDKVVKGLKNINIDYCAYDEVDNTVGSRLRQLTLHNDNIKIKERASYTATPRYNNGMGMENHSLYGLPAFRYTHKNGVEDGIICDYEVLVLDEPNSQIQTIINRNLTLITDMGLEGENAARIITSLISFDKAVGLYGIKKAITSHSRNSYAAAFAQLIEENKDIFPNLSKFKAFSVKGGNPKKVKDTLKELNNCESGVICNCRVLGVGIDVPNLELAIFVDPKGTIQGIVQAVGRIQRKAEGKEVGYVLLPVVSDDEGKVIRNKAYENMITNLTQLAQSNEFLRDEIIQTTRPNGGTRPRRIIIPPTVDISFEELQREISIKVLENKFYLPTIEEVIDTLKSIEINTWEQFIDLKNTQGLEGYFIPNNVELFYGEESRQKLYDYLQLKEDLSWLDS